MTAQGVDQIIIGKRHRKDLGDLQDLADSIRDIGLLHPIGVTPDHKLVFGQRRLVACRDLLGMTEIEVRVVNVSSIAAGEYAENEIRKDFTPSERVAILETIEQSVERHPGARTDLNQNFGRGERVADEVARRAGFGNRETARQAAAVVTEGAPELVEAMDKGAIKISAAAEIAKLPPAQQQRIVDLPPEERREAVRQARAQRDVLEAELADVPTINPWALRSRVGWTDKLVKKLLGDPDEGWDYDLERVEEAEKTEVFQKAEAAAAKARQRKTAIRAKQDAVKMAAQQPWTIPAVPPDPTSRDARRQAEISATPNCWPDGVALSIEGAVWGSVQNCGNRKSPNWRVRVGIDADSWWRRDAPVIVDWSSETRQTAVDLAVEKIRDGSLPSPEEAARLKEGRQTDPVLKAFDVLLAATQQMKSAVAQSNWAKEVVEAQVNLGELADNLMQLQGSLRVTWLILRS
jgi:ParB-like chromosome segregation protein Spo0J